MNCSRLYQHGRVAAIDGHTVEVVFEPLRGCVSCATGCGLVQIATLIGGVRHAALSVGVGAHSKLAVGDRVQVGIDARRLLRLVFVTYIFPLIGLFGGGVAGATLMPDSGDIGALSGAVVGGLLTGLSLLALAGRRRSLAWLGARVVRAA